MKNLINSFLVLAMFGFLFTSCDSDDDNNINGGTDPEPENEVRVSGFITEDETWTNDKIWILEGKVVVDNGATLTIDPGTIVKGEQGVQTLASALIIDNGAKLNAVGSASEPIVFTSVLDNIEIGQTAGTNLTIQDRNLWGGVIVLGTAPCSFQGNAEQELIEGLPENSGYGLYGGNNPNDNSGHLEYISIRHGGAEIGEGNEINGLTLGGVGNGTIIRNIEVIANLDDGIEWFGGTVDSSNLIVWGCGDDAFDLDQAYSGTISNGVIVQTIVSDHAFEIDGPEGDFQDGFTIENVTVFNDNSTESATNSGNREHAQFRDGALGSFSNALLLNGLSDADVNLTDDTESNYTNGLLTFSNIEIELPAGVSVSDLFTDTTGTSSFSQDAVNFVSPVQSINNATTGATLSAFNWTYTAQNSGRF
ncbi:hypothetical protein [Psychroflexus salis]|uniref:T9SS C-terminal target domain-containing protein n=1 Tax=Psychroflexus salis TaxID=1526574 RepID=A0A917E851_9FLAO|nr:hypothetical protein [Psychroflexus salis]GGE14401.1 hypothetical protein GCM10010831_14720 [Psychroflexus salis]